MRTSKVLRYNAEDKSPALLKRFLFLFRNSLDPSQSIAHNVVTIIAS